MAVFLTVAGSAPAFAAVYECSVGTVRNSQQHYLLVVDRQESTSAIFSRAGGAVLLDSWTLKYGKAELGATPGGVRQWQIRGTDTSPTQWNGNECWAWKEPSITIVLPSLDDEEVHGRIGISPNLVFRPGSRRCNAPQIEPSPWQELTCRRY